MKSETVEHEDKPRGKKKSYTSPRLERFGTVRELTLGTGNKKGADGAPPYGNNKTAF